MSYDTRKLLPTKINLIRLRKERSSLRKIRNILLEKRNALLLFIRAYLEEYEKVSQQTYNKIKEAEKLFSRAAIEMGHDSYREFTSSFHPSVKIRVKSNIVFTIKTPIFIVDESTFPQIPTFIGIPIIALNAIEIWRDAFKDYMRVIELEQILRKLIEELKDTQRLINALDNVVLPSLDRAINFIKMILDERAREEFIRTKFIKKKLEKTKEIML